MAAFAFLACYSQNALTKVEFSPSQNIVGWGDLTNYAQKDASPPPQKTLLIMIHKPYVFSVSCKNNFILPICVERSIYVTSPQDCGLILLFYPRFNCQIWHSLEISSHFHTFNWKWLNEQLALPNLHTFLEGDIKVNILSVNSIFNSHALITNV